MTPQLFKSSRNIIGRQPEIAIFKQALASNEAEWIAVYGRRRVGKTFLVREFFGNAICFQLIGLHQTNLTDQLANFADALAKAQKIDAKIQPPSSWLEAFIQLRKYIESLPVLSKRKRVVFFDELPWLDTWRSHFCSALEHFWNSWASTRKDLILVVCGSAASWMVQNIVRAKGGLHHRVTRTIRLMPFTLGETAAFLESKRCRLTPYQNLELYMALGGVPHYLNMVDRGWSASQAIDTLCFSEQGQLRAEFELLYQSLFDHASDHLSIVQALAKSRRGLTRNELIETTGLSSGGSMTLRLNELVESGFLQQDVPFGKQEYASVYRLSDEFSLFHCAWIAPLRRKNPGMGHWQLQRQTSAWRAWSGFTFEGICSKHIRQMKTALGIHGVLTTHSPWQYRVTRDEQGAQIDLLIDRADQTINLCEMKFCEGEFEIDKNDAEQLRHKRDIFRKMTKTRKNVLITMVTTHGLKDNAYARELISNTITADALFQT